MSGTLSTIDAMCGGGDDVKLPRGSIIPYIAQAYALALFQADFEVRYPAGVVLSELDVFKTNTGKSLIDLVLRVLSTDFRNSYAQTQSNRDRIKVGKTAEELKEGRSRKADALGIAVAPLRRAIVCELMEVTTANEAESTIAEDLVQKLAILRGPVKTLVDEQLRALRANQTLAPETFLASGTPWIIPPEFAIVPIFPESGMAREPSIYRWLCYAPTYKYRPMSIASPFVTNVEPDSSPAKGLILYSVHQSGNPDVAPDKVFKKVRQWAEQQRRREGLGPQLLPIPAATRYWQDNRRDLSQFLAWLGLGAVGVAVVVLAIYLAPALLGGGAAMLFQMGGAVDGVGLLAPPVIAALANYLPRLLLAARTMIDTAITVGGVSNAY